MKNYVGDGNALTVTAPATVAAGGGACYERALPVGDSSPGLRGCASNPWEGRAT